MEDSNKRDVGAGTVRGVAWLMSSRVLLLVVNFGSTAVLARLLSPADFGLVAAVLTVVGIVQIVTHGALSYPLVQRDRLDPMDVSTALWLSFAVAAIAGSSMIISGRAIERFFGFPRLATALAIATATLPLKGITSVSTALLQRERRFRQMATIAWVPQLFGYALPAIALARSMGMWSLITAQVTSAALEALLAYRLARPSLRPVPGGASVRSALHTAGLYSVQQTLNWLALNGTPVPIGRIFGDVALGFYSRASRFFTLATDLLGSTVADVLLPSFSRLQGERDRLSIVFHRALALSLFISGVGSTLVSIHAEAIVRILLGGDWTDTVPLMRALFVGLVARTAYKVTETLAFGQGRIAGVAARQALLLFLVAAFTVAGSVWSVRALSLGVSCAFWMFYAVSLARACLALGTSARWVMALHLRTAAIVGAMALIDVAILVGTRAFLPFWPRHVLAGAVAGAFALSVAFLAPARLVGSELAWLRDALRAHVRRGQ